MKFVADEQIGVTGCPGSNLQGRNIPNLKSLRIREVLERGVLWSMNPDDDLFMPDLEETFWLCEKTCQLTSNDKKLLIKNAWLTRFGGRKEHRF